MTTIQVELPDMLAQRAEAAGLLAPKALEALLREQLKRQAVDSLRAMWAREPQEEVTPEIERMIDEQVQAVRALGRAQAAH